MITRVFASPLDAQPSKRYREGFSLVTRDHDERRLTANPWTAGADIGLILGDSHVDAQQVDDDQTMGSVIERAARASGARLNVCQYGWGAEGLAAYLGYGAELKARWQPAWTAIVVNQGDFGRNALGGVAWRMNIDAAGDVQLTDRRQPAATSGPRYWLRPVFRRSALLTVAQVRIKEIWQAARAGGDAAADAAEPGELDVVVPKPALRDLKRLFGERLLLVYLPIVGVTTPPAAEPKEERFLAVCADEGLHCISLRAEMNRLRDDHRLARGFANTLPGDGHLNVLGHRVAGDAIWRQVTAAGWTARH